MQGHLCHGRVKRVKTLLKLLFWTVVVLVLLAVLGRIFIFNVARTHSYAMVPNLVPGDLFLVYTRATLGPGDMALCRDPEHPGAVIVSRILGVPGSTISIRNNNPTINGQEIQHQFDGNVIYEDNTAGEHSEFLITVGEEKVAGTLFSIALMERAGDKDFQHYAVEEGFFLVGDNRNRSRDSRHFGEVTIADCIGMPFLILWPGPDSGDFLFKNRILEWLH
jgi:signal peptidase I